METAIRRIYEAYTTASIAVSATVRGQRPRVGAKLPVHKRAKTSPFYR